MQLVDSKKMLAHALTRRSFGASTLASAVSYTAGTVTASAASIQSPADKGPYDVAIIGAGVAGIAAAQVCRAARNTSSIVLEARPRIGGRCYCNNSFEVPFDVGGQWFHFATPRADGRSGTNNPLLDIANSRQFRSRVRPVPDPNLVLREFYRNGQVVPAQDSDLTEVLQLQVGMLAAIDAAGIAIGMGLSPDISAAQATAIFAKDPWYDYVASTIALAGGAFSEQSTFDMYRNFRLGFDVGASLGNWLTPYGMGNFIRLLSAGLPIQLNRAAKSIAWGQKEGVSIETDAGTVKARTAIITVPPIVLATDSKDRLSFTPSLPDAQRDAMQALPMTAVEKVALQFSKNIFSGVRDSNIFAQLLDNGPAIKVAQARSWGHNTAVFLIDGPAVVELAKEGSQARIKYALDGLKAMFHGDPEKYLTRSDSSDWWTDPLSIGSYSYVGPGHAPAREALSQPVGDQLFFAGEACSVDKHSSLPGAWESGQAAAGFALKTLH